MTELQRSKRLCQGDEVIVIAGKDKGKKGKILKILKKKDSLIVEGVNKVVRHTKPNQENAEGGMVEKNMPIHPSNVALVDPKTNKATRVGIKVVTEDGGKQTRVRFAKKSGEELKKKFEKKPKKEVETA